MRAWPRAVVVVPLAMIAACSRAPDDSHAVDLEAAANRAQGDIDNYAQATPRPAATRSPRPAAERVPAR